MNLAGLEQFHQGKGDDKAHRSPLKASQSQVHRREGSADDRPAQARAEIGLRGRGQSECLRNWIDCIPFAFLRRAMITKISPLIAVVGFACICISQAQSPTPAESPSPSQTPAKHRATKTPKATPAPATHPAPSPSPSKFNLGDLFKPKTSTTAASPAASQAAAKGTNTHVAMKAPAPGGGHGKVWVNTETHVYHKEGSHFYGTTKKGKYTTEAEAIKEGNKPAQH